MVSYCLLSCSPALLQHQQKQLAAGGVVVAVLTRMDTSAAAVTTGTSVKFEDSHIASRIASSTWRE